MPEDEAAEALLPDLKPAERKTAMQAGMWSGQSGVAIVRLDDYWSVNLPLTDFRPQKTEPDSKLDESIRPLWVPAPGDQNGKWVTYYVNGQVSHEIEYKAGQYDGTFTAYRSDGSKLYQQHYKLGVCEGADTGWHANGKKSYEGQYKRDKQDGPLATLVRRRQAANYPRIHRRPTRRRLHQLVSQRPKTIRTPLPKRQTRRPGHRVGRKRKRAVDAELSGWGIGRAEVISPADLRDGRQHALAVPLHLFGINDFENVEEAVSGHGNSPGLRTSLKLIHDVVT